MIDYFKSRSIHLKTVRVGLPVGKIGKKFKMQLLDPISESSHADTFYTLVLMYITYLRPGNNLSMSLSLSTLRFIVKIITHSPETLALH